MQLHEVDEVMEVFLVKDVNEALGKDWKIVAVVSSVMPSAADQGPVACYVLGRKKPKPAPKISAAALAKANEGLSR